MMINFSNANICIAVAEDIAAIKELLNSAYRGDASKNGWTTEAHLIGGDQRIDAAGLMQVMQLPGSVFLKYTNDEQEMLACVNLQKHLNKIYLGMFSVSPGLQGSGIGKKLLAAAEEYAISLKCEAIYMSVISVRSELIDWYKRHGYSDTGERKAFVEDNISGNHLQPLEFMMMEKKLL